MKKGTRPIPDTRNPIPAPRYPGYDVMSQRGHWDEATRAVILDRLHNVPAIEYFTPDEVRLLQAVCDRIIPQDERRPEDRVPIVPWIDQRCQAKLTNGIRYEDMPDDWLAWRRGLTGIDETSHAVEGKRFAELDEMAQDDILRQVARGDAKGDTWKALPARRFFYAILLAQISGVYYAHPAAWNEIGFGGPAYPRGYLALNFGRREPWEVDEAR
ncbi:MAG: gluconate 2-dehydrogenase subunit 3 family protein [Dehalococcoidia bacterium]